jgi:hypothetical protein
MMRPLLLTLAIILLPSTAFAENPEVAFLLDWVRTSDCTFIRNGDNHPASKAAEHLAMKYSRGRRWIDSAEDFIARVGTGSSLSGAPYRVHCPGQPEQYSAAWLMDALVAHRHAQSSTHPATADAPQNV